MLGIRHYKNTAIDLYSGEMRWFYSDIAVVPNVVDYAPVADRVLELPLCVPEDTASWIQEALVWASLQGLRHVAIACLGSPVATMQAVKAHIDLESPSSLRRITFVLPDLQVYGQFQEALFRTFPEGENA